MNEFKCEYCEGNVDDREYLVDDHGVETVYIDGNNSLTFENEDEETINIQINFCPVCGRKF